MKAAIRVNSLTLGGVGNKTLWVMENHGKRLDATSQKRRVRDVAPLVHGTLDLRAAYDKHVAGARMNAGLKRPVMHALIQFPPELGKSEKNRKTMLHHAVRFINETHGGDAVFAARLDQDEAGMASVDVFYSPKYEKRTTKGADVWISTSKHGKLLAEKHREEIERRHNGQFSTGPRQVGIALQSELHEYLSGIGLKLEPRAEKVAGRSDRVDPELFKARRDMERHAEVAAARAERSRELEAEAALLQAETVQLRAKAVSEQQAVTEMRREVQKRVEQVERRERALTTAMREFQGLLRGVAERVGIEFVGGVRTVLDRIRERISAPVKTAEDPFSEPVEYDPHKPDRGW